MTLTKPHQASLIRLFDNFESGDFYDVLAVWMQHRHDAILELGAQATPNELFEAGACRAYAQKLAELAKFQRDDEVARAREKG